MKCLKIYILFLLSVACNNRLAAQATNDSVFQYTSAASISLTDAATHKNTSLKNIAAATPLILFIFLSPECPMCQTYSPVLNDLQRQYGKSVAFIGIIPGKTYSAATVQAFARKYKIAFSLLIDQQKKLTNYFQASITPEVILLNSQYELVYKGAVDNRLKQLGAKRWQATENYLSDAVSQYLQHTTVVIKRVKATGCLINDF